MIGEHWCWWLLTIACVVWYSTITIYVAVKGASDIKQMLKRLSGVDAQTQSDSQEEEARR